MCGFTEARLRDGVEGRVDDMIWIRGINVFPSAIEAVVRGFGELGGNTRSLSKARALPTLRVRAEPAPGAPLDGIADLEQRLRRAISAAIRATVDVEIVGHGTLPRADGRQKRRRIADRRTDQR